MMQAKGKFLPGISAGLFKQFRFQLVRQELVGEALLYENVVIVTVRQTIAQEFACIVGSPG